MNPLYLLIVAESFVVGWMWHNKSARFEIEHKSDRPDPAVLFSRSRSNFGKSAPPKQVQITVKRSLDKQRMKDSTI
jgi:hypothetical protein